MVSAELKELVELAKGAGLEGTELSNFLRQREREKEEREREEKEREREEKEREREGKEREHQRELPVIGGKIVLLLRSEIFGKRKDFRQFDKYFFGIIYYIKLLCTCVVKSFW